MGGIVAIDIQGDRKETQGDIMATQILQKVTEVRPKALLLWPNSVEFKVN